MLFSVAAVIVEIKLNKAAVFRLDTLRDLL